MDSIFTLITEYSLALIIILSCISLILIVISVVALRSAARANKRIDRVMGSFDKDSIEHMLMNSHTKLQDMSTEINIMKQDMNKIDTKLAFALSHVGIVRYNAFEDTRNNLSFSIALLDRFHNGLVFTSIYGRDFNSVYGKPVKFGKSEYQISKEEDEAIRQAISGEEA